jgi:MoaA/NifB/PqqE/SkfB family radical SAM enzyme
MHYEHTVARVRAGRAPFVLVPQFFGSTVFDRGTSRYYPFDHEATEILTALLTERFDDLQARFARSRPAEQVRALESFYEHLSRLGLFTVDQRFAGERLDVVPPADHLVGPLAVHLEVAASCNLTCVHCFAGELPRREERLEMGRLDALFAEMAAVGSFRLGLTGGEPLLRRDLFDIIDLATNHGLHPCVTTNGLLVDEEVARAFGERDLVWLNVSLEGATAETNDAVRGPGTFDRVMERLAVLRRHTTFTLAFTITSANADEIEACVRLSEHIGASTAVFRPLYPVGVAREHLDLMPTFDQYTSALDAIASVAGEERLHHIDPFSPRIRAERQSVVHTNLGCGAGNLVASISLSGGMNPCSFLGPEYVAGSVAETSFTDLWHDSDGFRGIRALPGGNACSGGCGSADHNSGDADHFAGGCRARALVLNGHINAADPWLTPGGAHPLRTLELRPVVR